MKQKHQELFLFAMNSRQLNRICYVTPRSHDDPQEIQRILKKPRAKLIASYLEQATNLLPTAIVVSLDQEVVIAETGTPGTRTITFPDEAGKFAYVLDGQHRLAGFKESPIQFDLPVVALYGADEATRAKVFADINSKQERITDTHILELYYQVKDLGVEETAVVDVIHTLNEMPGSPLQSRIKTRDDDKNTWVKNTILKRFLVRALKPSGISVKSPAQQASILAEYLKAVRLLWPNAWDQKGYVLSSSVGLEVMLGVFPAAKHRVDLNRQKEYGAESFLSQIEPLREADVPFELPDGSTSSIRVDWKKDRIKFLSSSQRGRNLLIDAFNRVLHESDEGEGDEEANSRQ
jgi:DGQHR domain-containing protein